MDKIMVTRSSMPSFDEYCEEIRELWESRWLTNSGAKHQQFQKDLAKYLDTEHVTLYTNGHLALENAIAAMDLPKGGEVITTPFTFVSTTHAIVRNGLIPVFCDIDEEYYTIDVSKIESLITDKTCAIVPVHVYGNVCDIDTIKEIADRYGLKVIYDAAHAFGTKYNGKSVANYGDAAMFSFHATKVFNTIEGGAVCYGNDELVKKLDMMKNFGISSEDDISYIGTNAKMSEFQAAMGICNLRYLDWEIAKRKVCVEKYRELLGAVDGIKICPQQENVTANYAYFPIVVDGIRYIRDEVMKKLAENNIYARKYFYPLTNMISCYNGETFDDWRKTPIAADIAERVITLPLYADLTVADVNRICSVIVNSMK